MVAGCGTVGVETGTSVRIGAALGCGGGGLQLTSSANIKMDVKMLSRRECIIELRF
jgi:hypothetical protein